MRKNCFLSSLHQPSSQSSSHTPHVHGAIFTGGVRGVRVWCVVCVCVRACVYHVVRVFVRPRLCDRSLVSVFMFVLVLLAWLLVFELEVLGFVVLPERLSCCFVRCSVEPDDMCIRLRQAQNQWPLRPSCSKASPTVARGISSWTVSIMSSREPSTSFTCRLTLRPTVMWVPL